MSTARYAARVAMDIVPIQLSLTAGDLITLWAPRWRAEGEEWEGFLGDEESLHAFPDVASLAAYVRTVPSHDLADHPAWPLMAQLGPAELVPEENQCYDLVGVPEIVAQEPDTWTIGELSAITTVVRSLADTCGLETVHDVLNSAEAFALLERDSWVFSSRDSKRLWTELADAVVNRWDEVIDELDGIVTVPEVDKVALAAAQREFDEAGESDEAETAEEPGKAAAPAGDATEAIAFWERVGIDPILISTDDTDHYTLRCYVDDKPVFLGSGGRIDTCGSARALVRFLADDGATGHDLTKASTWSEVAEKATAGELAVVVDPQNTYQLIGLTDDLLDGPTEVDPNQLDLAVELLLDVGRWGGDEGPEIALAPSASLGWLTSFVLRPDPSRLAPSPPFDAEAARWSALVDDLNKRLRPH